jgi:hypothetical protein
MFEITSSFDKFSFDTDPFKNDQPVPLPRNITNGNNNNNNDFDPFGITQPPSNKQQDSFDPFGLKNGTKSKLETSGFEFETDFANFDAFNGNKKSNDNSTNGDFDAWGESVMDKQNNNLTLTNEKINKNGTERSKIRKFSADYSDNFDQDLEQTLKRSMIDK